MSFELDGTLWSRTKVRYLRITEKGADHSQSARARYQTYADSYLVML